MAETVAQSKILPQSEGTRFVTKLVATADLLKNIWKGRFTTPSPKKDGVLLPAMA
jgi:hypothetical protein